MENFKNYESLMKNLGLFINKNYYWFIIVIFFSAISIKMHHSLKKTRK